ncbi:MAG TPA: GAF domain-containing protein [Marmoricola sp.]|nr:GAF domain-containing protein [Marmoricola sp.]
MPTIQEIFASLAQGDSGTTLPQRLCEDCRRELPVTGVGIALFTEQGHAGLVAATDGTARELEDLQFTLGEGPCLDASAEFAPVLVPDLETDTHDRWPAFTGEALDAGVAAVFAFPLQVGAIRMGVLDLYRDTPGELGAGDVADALRYADAAVLLLLHLQGLRGPEEGLHPDLLDTMDGRPEIHQATGMIAVQANVTLAAALLLLRGHAFSAGRTTVQVARDVVTGRTRFPREERSDG